MRLSQKLPYTLLFSAPTSKPVGSYFVTNSEPTALVVGVPKKIIIPKQIQTFETASSTKTE